jgi:transcriptional regulator with XRE-family HTH domain
MWSLRHFAGAKDLLVLSEQIPVYSPAEFLTFLMRVVQILPSSNPRISRSPSQPWPGQGIAYMLPLMKSAAAILREARTDAGLSRRALAAKAEVPTSTVSRIEEGLSDPTLGMLARLIRATGSYLVVEARPEEDRLSIAELATAWEDTERRLKIDWTRLRAFVDRVEMDPRCLSAAIADPPAPTHPLVNRILAALAEQLADEYDIEPPRWTRAFGALDDPWAPPSTPRMRAAFEESTPEAFRRRNLVLPRSALFRTAA